MDKMQELLNSYFISVSDVLVIIILIVTTKNLS